MMKRGWGLALAVSLLFVLGGTAEAATVNPAAKDFGAQNVGASGAPVPFVLQSSANYCGHVDPVLFTCDAPYIYSTNTNELGGPSGGTATKGDFRIHNIDCPAGLSGPYPIFLGAGPPGSCNFEVSFVPVAAGVRSFTLSFPDTGGAAGALTLIGTGIGPPVTTPSTTTSTKTKKKCKKKKKHHRCRKKR